LFEKNLDDNMTADENVKTSLLTKVIQVLDERLKQEGFSTKHEARSDEFLWRPDILAIKGKHIEAFLIRESNTVPPVLVQRIAVIKDIKHSVKVSVVFCNPPTAIAKKILSLYGVGVWLFRNNRFIIINESKQRHTRLKKKKLHRITTQQQGMTQQNVFISSQQISSDSAETLPERKSCKMVIDKIRNTHQVPIFGKLVEDDARYTFDKIRECILKNLDESNWFICILTDEFRKIIIFEVKEAHKRFKANQVILFLKSSKESKESWKSLLEWIKKETHIKYIEYIDVNDYEEKLEHILMQKLDREYKRKNLSMF
jgi:hypothetical protein